MSPRAACRLTLFGFNAYDYTAGKADWRAAGLRTEGNKRSPVRAFDAMRCDVPTCGVESTAQEALQKMRAVGGNLCVVVNEDRVVLGRLRSDLVSAARSAASVEELMEPGPTTIRADADLDETRQHLRESHVASVLVTTPDGELLGELVAEP